MSSVDMRPRFSGREDRLEGWLRVVRDLLQRFGLPNEYLAKIWSLSSITPNPANPGLSLPEFLLACHLCRLSVTSRQPPPDYLPDNYRAEVVQAVFNLRGGQQQQQQQPQQSFQLPQQQFANQQQQFMNTQSIARPAMQPQPIMSPQAAGPSFAQFQQPQQPQSFSQPQSFQQSQSFANQSQSFTAPSSASPWTITPADRATFDQVFRAWDPRNTGYVLGDTAREIFGQSGLAANVLARIW
ncbi:hypothetical protein M427DRAFT_461682 [Gonapodya prolifera JEL478]|uniref:EH domain-containing protein n=1 Tax=Gonapodya prolifera (strain JEL478) TaxID=1344416 RepID=A0A139A2L2_GONPJ|nr:hypothetical protein M427DRAFT_461682 [Gonapodya prolifera JEL478]|eukprot:KXS10785.1 hypothetical protein M427DRAFT_461682 [Gonapodya prolifera JEL478]